MKHTPLVGALMLCMGFAIGWLAKPSAPAGPPAAEKTATNVRGPETKPGKPASEPAKETPPPPGKREIREATVKKTMPQISDEDMEQAKKMQGEMTKAMVGRQRSKLENHLERLAQNLNLTPEQKTKMTGWLGDKLKQLEKLDLTDPESMKNITDLTKGLTTKSLEEELASMLTQEQQTSLTAFQEKDTQTKIDSTALKRLSQLQGIIDLEEGQRDEVYKILSASAAEQVRKQEENPDPTALFTEGMGIDMDPYGLGIKQAMTELSENAVNWENPGDQKEIARSMREIIDQRINERVEQLRPVLNEKQLEQYRTELKTKGPGLFGAALMSMENDSPSSTIVVPAK